MRIIQLASGDLWAGAEVQLYHLAVHLTKLSGVNLLVVLFNHGQLENMLREQGIKVIVLDETKLNGFQLFVELKRLANVFNPDVIHTHRLKENIIGGLVAKVTGCKSVRTVHGASEFSGQKLSLRRRIVSFLDNFSGKYFQHKIIAVSDELKEKLLTVFPENKLSVIENSIDVQYLKNRANESIGYNIPCNQFNVAFIGRFVEVKRVDLFFDLAKYFIESYPDKHNVHFYMVGDGPLKQGIENKLVAENMVERIHLTGFVDNPAPLLAEMDLLLFTSDHEGLPMALLEAMVLGVPVMSRQLATIVNVLCSGECGLIIDSVDVQSFAEKIITLMEEPDLLRKISDAAYHRVMESFSIDSNIKQYEKNYKDIVNS